MKSPPKPVINACHSSHGSVWLPFAAHQPHAMRAELRIILYIPGAVCQHQWTEWSTFKPIALQCCNQTLVGLHRTMGFMLTSPLSTTPRFPRLSPRAFAMRADHDATYIVPIEIPVQIHPAATFQSGVQVRRCEATPLGGAQAFWSRSSTAAAATR